MSRCSVVALPRVRLFSCPSVVHHSRGVLRTGIGRPGSGIGTARTISVTRKCQKQPQQDEPRPTRPRLSEGTQPAAIEEALSKLLASESGGGRWQLSPDGEGLERTFKFKTFGKTWDFMTAVSLQCKLRNHHPEWSNVFNTTYIRWTTHSPAGLSARDVELAGICDVLAMEFGEIAQPAAAADSCGMRELSDKSTGSAGDCCRPKATEG